MLNALLSGLETETLTQTEFKLLESCNTQLLRRVIGLKGTKETEGVLHKLSDTLIRERSYIYWLHSLLRKRRLDRYKQNISEPDNNRQLRAAAFGKIQESGFNIEFDQVKKNHFLPVSSINTKTKDDFLLSLKLIHCSSSLLLTASS